MIEVKIVRDSIATEELESIAREQFGDLVKVVVDIRRGVMAVGGELHADEEAALIADGSRREHTWGVNLYPARSGEEWIEYDSMVNIKPAHGNRSRGVKNPEMRKKIQEAVEKLVKH